MLLPIATALTSIDTLRVEAVEQAFECTLVQDVTDARQYRAQCPGPPPFDLDVRIGTTGGIVVAQFEDSLPDGYTRALAALGTPVSVDVVPPPLVSSPGWVLKRSLAFPVGGTRVWVGLQGEGADERLAYLSRSFEAHELT